jgi:ribonuclease-3
VLSLIIGEYLYGQYPGKDEGFLSQMRARVVNREFFNSLGYALGIDKLLAENSANGTPYEISPSMVGNCFEALFGAIFLDKGYKKAKRFFESVILAQHLDIGLIQETNTNYKSILLEHCQKYGKTIGFTHVNTLKEGNQLLFVINVIIDGVASGSGEGLQKKKAEQQAAKNALLTLGILEA